MDKKDSKFIISYATAIKLMKEDPVNALKYIQMNKEILGLSDNQFNTLENSIKNRIKN